MNFSRLHTLRLQEWRNRDVEQNSLQEFDDIREPGDNSDPEDTGDLEGGGYGGKNYHWTPSLIQKRGYSSLQQVGLQVSPE